MGSRERRLTAAFVLTLVGSALVLVSGVVVLVLYLTLAWRGLEPPHLIPVALLRRVGVLVALVTLVPGVLGLLASVLIRLNHPVAGGVLAIVAAVASIPLFLGVLLAGFLTLLIGGVLAILSPSTS